MITSCRLGPFGDRVHIAAIGPDVLSVGQRPLVGWLAQCLGETPMDQDQMNGEGTHIPIRKHGWTFELVTRQIPQPIEDGPGLLEQSGAKRLWPTSHRIEASGREFAAQ